MEVCILNQAGEILVHQHVKARPEIFLKVMTPDRDALVVAKVAPIVSLCPRVSLARSDRRKL